MTKLSKKVIVTIISITLLVLIGYYIWYNWEDFAKIRVVNPVFLLILIVGVIANLYSTGAVLDHTIRPLNLNIGRLESFGLAAITRFVNQVAPGRMGFFVRASYLKKQYGFSFTNSLSTLTATHVVMYVAGSILGLLSIVWLVLINDTINLLFASLFACILLGVLLLFCIPAKKLVPRNTNSRLKQRLAELSNGWNIIRNDTKTLKNVFFLSCINGLTNALVVYGAFNALGGNFNLLQAVFVSSILIIGSVVSLTPAGLGINEGLMVIAGTAVGVPPPVSLVAAVLKRLVMFIILTLLALIFAHKLFDTSLWFLLRKKDY